MLMRHRRFLIRQRTQCNNRIHAFLANYNLTSPTADLFGVNGRQWLSEILNKEQLREAACQVIRVHLALIDQLDIHIEALENSRSP